MPVPIPGPEVGSDSLKVKFLMIFGRPKTGFLEQISGAPGYIPPIPASYQPRRDPLEGLWGPLVDPQARPPKVPMQARGAGGGQREHAFIAPGPGPGGPPGDSRVPPTGFLQKGSPGVPPELRGW